MTSDQKRLDDWHKKPPRNDKKTPLHKYKKIPLMKNYPVICPHCGCDIVIKKENKKRKYKKKGKQYQCKNKNCGKKFIDEVVKGHFPPWIVYTVLGLAMEGLNTRQIAKTVEKIAERQNIDIKMAHTTIYNILKRTVKILLEFEAMLCFAAEDEWEIDELFQNLANKRKAYVFNIIGLRSKYWFASYVSLNRNTAAASEALRLARQRARYHPFSIKCDGLASYKKAIKMYLPKTKIDQKTKTENFFHINIVERLNLTGRRILKRYRHFRSMEKLQQLVDLYRIHYNFIRKHEGLKGLTPAFSAGFPYQFNDWQDLLKYARYYILKTKYSHKT